MKEEGFDDSKDTALNHYASLLSQELIIGIENQMIPILKVKIKF